MVKKKKFIEVKDPLLLKLDLGCGKGAVTPDGFLKIDKIAHPGVRAVDLRKKWPWGNNTVDEVHCGYMVNYFTAAERVHFMHELYRVLKPGSKATIITPYWAACAAYGDVTVQWPPVTEAWYVRLNKAWREAQNYQDPDGYTCNFEHTIGYGLHHSIMARNQEYQQHAVSFFKEAAQQLVATLIKVG